MAWFVRVIATNYVDNYQHLTKAWNEERPGDDKNGVLDGTKQIRDGPRSEDGKYNHFWGDLGR